MRVVTLVIMDGNSLGFDCCDPLYDQLQSIGHQQALGLFLSSRGGQTEVPWRIVSLLREYCKELIAVIPYRAHSAATHIAIGADRIVMSPRSQLTPVDPTRQHPLAPVDKAGSPIPISVQDFKSCISFLWKQQKEQQKSEYPAETLGNIFIELFRHVEPLFLGAIEESYELSKRITRKILETHMDGKADRERIEHIVTMLADEYHSHVYPISRVEARDDLHLDVEFADIEMTQLMDGLLKYYEEVFQAQYKDSAGNRLLVENIAALDTTETRMCQRRVFDVIEEDGKPKKSIVAQLWCSSPEQAPDSDSLGGPGAHALTSGGLSEQQD